MDKFDRFTIREALTVLDLSNMAEFRRLKIRLGVDELPRLISDTFGKAEIMKMKNQLDALDANTQPPAPPPPTYDRRSGIADRRGKHERAR